MISVLVSAFQAQDYLEDLIQSIDYDRAELLICIDNCFDTFTEAKRLEKLYPQVRFFDSNVNNGPYININSLVKHAKYDYILPFGADDYFKNNVFRLLEKCLNAYKWDVIRFPYTNFKENKYLKVMNCVADGAFVMSKSFFITIGGFQAWRCAADTELKLRALELGAKEDRLHQNIFMRRLHNNNLSKVKGLKSKERREAIKYINDNKGKRKPIIITVVKLNRI
jgi:glycosyltransferase involved in cell wall biosynthesis